MASAAAWPSCMFKNTQTQLTDCKIKYNDAVSEIRDLVTISSRNYPEEVEMVATKYNARVQYTFPWHSLSTTLVSIYAVLMTGLAFYLYKQLRKVRGKRKEVSKELETSKNAIADSNRMVMIKQLVGGSDYDRV